jgi:hypothetical protein
MRAQRFLVGLFGIGAISAAAALLGLASAAAGASNTPPVTINSCGPIIDKNQTQNYFGVNVPVSTSSGIGIEFVNESKQTATLVNFAVDSNGDQFVIRDVGKFSPGVSIKHQYRNGQGQSFVLPAFIAPKIKCHVASVEFADGTVWRKGQGSVATTGPVAAPAQSKPGLTATPVSLNIDGVSTAALFLVSSGERVAAFKETDNCAKIASIFVAATADSSATYSVKPIAAGSCSATVTDEDGHTVSVPIVVR